MHKDGSAFVGLDTSKLKISVALTDRRKHASDPRQTNPNLLTQTRRR
jgi:hypothetical protein